jgi:hypothetical protein
MMKKLSLLVLVILSALAVFVMAEEKEGHDHGTITEAQKTIEGTLVCTGCSLKKYEGAQSQCSVYGHTHSLRTSDGKYINFLPNKFSDALMKGEKYHNQKVTVTGVYHASANMLDVQSYTVEGNKSTWCDGCKAMDGHASKQ